MKAVAIASLFVLCASLASAGLTPGTVVPDGEALPFIADVNGDGLADIVQARSVMLNTGTGQFQKHALPLLYNNAVAADWLDVNGDGRPDLLVNNVAIAPPPSTGSAAPLVPSSWAIYISTGWPNYTPVGLALPPGAKPFIADVNGDGKDDIVAIAPVFGDNGLEVASEWTVLISRGDGTFGARPTFRTLPDPQTGVLRHLLVGDMDSDGHPDIVARFVNDVVVLRGDGNGNLTPGPSRFLPWSAFGGWGTQLADVDGDGNLDLIMTYYRSVRVLLGNGHGGFTRVSTASMQMLHTATAVPYFADAIAPISLAVGHFVSSDRTEIAGATPEGEVVIVAWDNNSLREVGRIETAFLWPDDRVGAFRPGHTDLYLTWTSDVVGQPPRQVFNADASPAQPATRSAVRTRATRTAAPSWTVSITTTSGDCTPGQLDSLPLTNDGLFSHYQGEQATVDIVRDDQGVMYLRLAAAWTASYPQALAQLQPTAGGFAGTANILTTCGEKPVSFVATPHS
jgi:hypothetical protein